MEAFAVTDRGLVRDINEDRYLIREMPDGSSLLMVADGLGGHPGAETASEVVWQAFARTRDFSEHPLKQMCLLVAGADQTISEKAHKASQLEGMGSTVTAAWVQKGRVDWIHVGDSRLYLLQNKELTQVTTDQNMAQFLVEEGELTPEEARRDPARNLLDQCVGCGDCEPMTGSFPLKGDDLLLLTSDGLHGDISPTTIFTILLKKTSIKTKVSYLIQAALDAGGADNITALLYKQP